MFVDSHWDGLQGDTDNQHHWALEHHVSPVDTTRFETSTGLQSKNCFLQSASENEFLDDLLTKGMI